MQEKNSIIASLDKFIRKYYKNRMIKGIIYALALLLSLFLVIVLLESFGYFSKPVRAFLFWFYLVSAGAILVYYVAVPLAKMFRLGKVISYDEAARIVGNHFPEVSDKLLNLIQLQRESQSASDSLLTAAIEQKTAQLKPVPFQQAIDLKVNKKYLKFAAIPLIIIVVLLCISPTLLTEPSHRISHYNTAFERPAPFRFVVENASLEVPQHEDFELKVLIDGNTIPAEVFVNVEGNIYRMRQIDKLHYSYLFKTLQSDCTFQLQAGDVVSTEYKLVVYPKPLVVDFQTVLTYPSYIGKPQETLTNEGDVVVPQGTVVKWQFYTQNTDTLFFFVNDETKRLIPDGNGRVSLSLRAMQSFEYGFSPLNAHTLKVDTLRYSLSTIADNAPMIAVFEMRDSALDDRLFFDGRIKDDYGFSKLEFKVVKYNTRDTSNKTCTCTEIGLGKDNVQEFRYTANMNDFQLNPGDKCVYYFEVWDNDAIHGPKSTTSQQFEIVIPTERELDNLLNTNSNEAQQQARQSLSELKKMQQDINELMRKLVDKKELDWQDKRDLQELSKKQESVKKMLQSMQQQLQENKRLEQKYKEQSDKLLEKQQELDRLMNEVLTDEMKQMMQEIDRMMQEVDKKKVQEQLDNLKTNNEDLEKQLNTNIELMKRLELEKKVEDAIHKTEQLAEKQKELADKTEQSKSKDEKEELLKKQQELSSEFEQLEKDIKQIQQDYKKIDQNIDFKVDDNQLKKIEQNQQNAEDKLNKNNGKGASKHQKEAAEQLEQLSEQLAESQQDVEQQDLAEDAEMVRQLLKNLVTLSFNQESLIDKVKNTYIQDPKYQSLIVGQNKVKDDFRTVEDSLRAIAKRQVAVAAVIGKNVADVNSNITRSLSGLLDMNQSFYGTYKNVQASNSMQYTMTSFNNLALVMAESLDKMNEQMRQNQQRKSNGSCKNTSQKKQGNCSKPGNSKPSPKSMRQMQQELNKQMEALKKQLDKQGKKPDKNGRKKIGDKGSMQLSEEFARMAAQQEMIRRMMQQYGQEMKQENAGNAKLAKEIEQMMRQMEQTENDLVNKVITQQTINRQNQIMTRLLEHEKAEMQREKEERRESHEGNDKARQQTQSEIEQYQRLKEKNMELFRTVPPTLSRYYMDKVNDYFYNF